MVDEYGGIPTGELPRVSLDDTGGPPRPRRRRRHFRFTLKFIALCLVVWFFVLPLIPGLRKATTELSEVNPWLLMVGLALQMAALFCYSLLTKAALGEGGASVTRGRLFRIQMSTRALSSIVPGGSAAGSALGYRLLTLSGVQGADAGFALATAGLVSAVTLNVILWIGLIISIPVRGVNPLYGSAAVVGVVIMAIVGTLVLGLMEGQGRAERIFRRLAVRFRFDPDRAGAAVRQIGGRLSELIADRQLLGRVAVWAVLNWLLDAASLWVFLLAFGPATDVDGLIVAFGLANVFAVVPITPGGIGLVEGIYIPTLVGFGLASSHATLGVISYRLAQYWFPILLGGFLYLSLRVGHWSLRRREQLKRLRELVAETEDNPETLLDFAARFSRSRPRPAVVSTAEGEDHEPRSPATGDVIGPDPGDDDAQGGWPARPR